MTSKSSCNRERNSGRQILDKSVFLQPPSHNAWVRRYVVILPSEIAGTRAKTREAYRRLILRFLDLRTYHMQRFIAERHDARGGQTFCLNSGPPKFYDLNEISRVVMGSFFVTVADPSLRLWSDLHSNLIPITTRPGLYLFSPAISNPKVLSASAPHLPRSRCYSFHVLPQMRVTTNA